MTLIMFVLVIKWFGMSLSMQFSQIDLFHGIKNKFYWFYGKIRLFSGLFFQRLVRSQFFKQQFLYQRKIKISYENSNQIFLLIPKLWLKLVFTRLKTGSHHVSTAVNYATYGVRRNWFSNTKKFHFDYPARN